MWQPESEAEVGAGGEGTSGAAVKRGLSLEAATAAAAAAGQDVKRFRTATGAASTVRSIHHQSVARTWLLSDSRSQWPVIVHHHVRPSKMNNRILLPSKFSLRPALLCMIAEQFEGYFDQTAIFTSVGDKNCQQEVTARLLLLLP